ncbi:MAG: NAD(P)-dependent oxidoreductase, partial [candidate division NC10 bacterium]|nr:NAD(P)-dependent oxidoreductase [candidate division NC10 bacterium]
MKSKVGFIGLGEMGKWMAINVAKAEYPLTVYDVRSEPVQEVLKQGAAAAPSPSEVARKAEVVLLCLPDTQVVEAVIFGRDGLIHGLSAGSIVVDLSTINYLATLRIEEELRAKGVILLDAPISGLEARAKEGTLTIMVGGDRQTFEKVRPILQAMGKDIIYMGKSGNGQLTKLINQLFLNISCAATAEILPMAVKLGLDPEAVYKVVTTSTGRTFAFEFFTPYILENDFSHGYPLVKAYKDMISAAEISAKEKIPLPVFAGAMHTYQLALAQGHGNECKGAMIKVW